MKENREVSQSILSNKEINMKDLEVFVFILLLYLSSSSEGIINKQFKIVLENPLENFPLKNMEIDLEANIVYVSGKNILYRLSMEKDMKMMKRQTGPDANCLPKSSPEEITKYCGDDYNTVMVVTPDSLITCGTLRGGLCLRHNKESLNSTMTSSSSSSNIRLVSRENASAVGTFLNIRDNSSGKFENIVLFAKQYTELPLPLPQLKESAIFSVSPDLSKKVLGTSSLGNIFDLFLKTPSKVKMDYRVVIENENFVFLLVNQNSQSKLVKICKSIDSENPKKVYEDIPVSCYSEGTILTHVNHGTFITVSGKRYLVGLFSHLKLTLSAVCVFELNEVYEAFLESRRHRYGCPEKNDLPAEDIIFNADRGFTINCFPYTAYNKTNEPIEGVYDAFYKGDYCNKVTRLLPQFGIIVGLLPLKGNAVYSTKSHRVTVVGSSTINNLTTLYIGTDNGTVIQVFYDTEKNKTNELREIKVDSSEIRAVRRVNDETYVMSQNKIVKLLPTKNCGLYSELCQQCMDVRDAHCGWCVTKGICSTYSECTRLGNTYWLPSVKNECLSIDLSIDLSRHAYKMEEKLLIMMTPLNNLENMTCNLDGFHVSPSIHENVFCRIGSTIVFTERSSSSTISFGVFILIVAVINIFFLCVTFLCYKWGVRQGQKLNQKNQKANVADYYQSQNGDSFEETHTYEQPRPSTGQTSMRNEQELTAYDVIL